jgi:hypothetical protein
LNGQTAGDVGAPEARPAFGSRVCSAQIQLALSAKICALRDPRPISSGQNNYRGCYNSPIPSERLNRCGKPLNFSLV